MHFNEHAVPARQDFDQILCSKALETRQDLCHGVEHETFWLQNKNPGVWLLRCNCILRLRGHCPFSRLLKNGDCAVGHFEALLRDCVRDLDMQQHLSEGDKNFLSEPTVSDNHDYLVLTKCAG
jgi:hypothetical protein